MADINANPVAPKVLQALKAEVEVLWNSLINATDDKSRDSIRAQYREAFKNYRAQVSLTGLTDKQAADAKSDRAIKERPVVYDYQDYRAFFLDWFRYLKHRDHLTIELICGTAGVPVSELSAVFKGERRMRRGELQRLLPHLKLTAEESAYLEQLRSLTEAESAEERVDAAVKIQEVADFRKRNPAIGEAWRYLSHWYYVAIRELSTLGGFRARVDWVKSRLRGKVLESEVKRAMEFLEAGGFYRRSDDDRVVPLLKDISCMGGVYKVALGEFHREMLSKAADAIHELPSDQRWISGHTVALTSEQYCKAVAILTDALEKIGDLDAAEQSTDDVYHIGLFAVPLTKSGFEEAST